jgi:hypothetical protein
LALAVADIIGGKHFLFFIIVCQVKEEKSFYYLVAFVGDDCSRLRVYFVCE